MYDANECAKQIVIKEKADWMPECTYLPLNANDNIMLDWIKVGRVP